MIVTTSKRLSAYNNDSKTMRYNVGGDNYPAYAKHNTFSMPAGPGNSTIVCRRQHQRRKELTGWLLLYVGDDPESDWTLYKPGYCIDYPWDFDPEAAETCIPDESNEAKQKPWKDRTAAIKRFMRSQKLLLVDDHRIVRTIERYRR